MQLIPFLDPASAFPLPARFDFDRYIDAERELWAFFPEAAGKRVNFCQLGLTARLYIEAAEDEKGFHSDETYFLMPCADGMMRPLRMHCARALTLEEFRMTHLTSLRIMEKLSGTGRLMDEVHMQILGPEILAEG